MASIVKRKSKYSVVYTYKDEYGKKKQKWETWGTKKEAERRKREIETQKDNNTFVPPAITTLSELLYEFVNTYGRNKWAVSTYNARKGMIDNYINPILGDQNIQSITPKMMDDYYNKVLPNTKAAVKHGHKDSNLKVSNRTIKELHKILNCAFKQAVTWQYITRNPAENVMLPKVTYKKRKIWDFNTFQRALEVCEDERLALCMHLAFACSLRIGEVLALTWDCVDISDESIKNNDAHVYVDKTLAREDKESIAELNEKDIYKIFPSQSPFAKSTLVLKKLKTEGSNRKIWLPKTVSHLLQRAKFVQSEWQDILGNEYIYYNLVTTLPIGKPVDVRVLEKWFKDLIIKNELPDVVFHSLRHTSTTYKLKLYGDIKAVQGDTGHAQSKMVTEVYSHILDEDRKNNAEIFEKAFYQKSEEQPSHTNDDQKQKLLELLNSSPDFVEKMLELANQLSKGD